MHHHHWPPLEKNRKEKQDRDVVKKPLLDLSFPIGMHRHWSLLKKNRKEKQYRDVVKKLVSDLSFQ